jgi:hypothetical protein
LVDVAVDDSGRLGLASVVADVVAANADGAAVGGHTDVGAGRGFHVLAEKAGFEEVARKCGGLLDVVTGNALDALVVGHVVDGAVGNDGDGQAALEVCDGGSGGLGVETGIAGDTGDDGSQRLSGVEGLAVGNGAGRQEAANDSRFPFDQNIPGGAAGAGSLVDEDGTISIVEGPIDASGVLEDVSGLAGVAGEVSIVLGAVRYSCQRDAEVVDAEGKDVAH